MPLDSTALLTLTNGIMAAFSTGVAPPPNNASSDEIATAIVAAYNIYALNAMSCSGSPPTLVNSSLCETKLKAAMTGSNPDGETAAEGWHEAFEAFWTGGIFGVTGSVISILGGAAFELNLASLFNTNTNTMAFAAQQIAIELDTYTKTVMVRDTAIPPPTGCGPSPIS